MSRVKPFEKEQTFNFLKCILRKIILQYECCKPVQMAKVECFLKLNKNKTTK